MKKLLLTACALILGLGGVNAKAVLKYSLGAEMTLEEAVACKSGVVLVSDNQVLDINKLGDGGLTMRDVQEVKNAYLVKFEASGEGYHLLFHKPNASNIVAGDRYGIWGNSNCMLTAVYFNGDVSNSAVWVAPNNDKRPDGSLRPDGRDFDYGSRWIFEAQQGGGYAVYFNEGDGRKYLNGDNIGDAPKIWHLHTLTEVKKVGKTSFNMTKISFAEALISTDPVAMVQNDLVLCNSNGGANYTGKEEGFDEYAFWVKFEAEDESKNQYYITLNNQDGSKVNYLNSSVWCHVFLSDVKKDGTKGEKQDGAVFIVGDKGNNTYSLRMLGATEGHYNTDPFGNPEDNASLGWVNFCTDGYWANNATWKNPEDQAQAWEFYAVTDFHDVDLDEGDVPGWYLVQNEELRPFLDTNEGSVFYVLHIPSAGDFRTVCLANTAICLNATAYEVKGKDANYLYLSEVKKLEAGKAYFVQAKEAGAIEFVYVNDTPKADSPSAHNGLTGTFEATTAPEGSYVLSGNKLYRVDSKVSVGANRAYIDLAKVPHVTSEVKAVKLAFDDEVATSISGTDEQVQVKAIYSVNGTVQRGMKKGVNIVKMSDGSVKKVLVK